MNEATTKALVEAWRVLLATLDDDGQPTRNPAVFRGICALARAILPDDEKAGEPK